MTRRLSLRREELTVLDPADLGLVNGMAAIEAPTRDDGLCQTYTVTRWSVCSCDA